MVTFAIENVERSHKPTKEQIFKSLVVVLMNGKDWCMKIIFERHTFTLVTNTQQKNDNHRTQVN
jgi:hypothetical protein